MSKDKSRSNRPQKGAHTGDNNDPHRQRESKKYDKPIASREFITSTLREAAGPMHYDALAEKLGFTGNEISMEALRRRIGAMIRDGQLIQNRRDGLVPVDADNLLAGRISAHPDGFGFVIVEDSDKDIFLNGKQMRQVLHGDKVVVCVTGVDRRGRREGRIVDVVERANKSLVGRVSIDRGTAVVHPDNKRISQQLLISPGELGEARDGDMVVAEIVKQPTKHNQPLGKIIEVLGQHLRPGMEIDVALHSHGIPAEWPEAVLEQAASFSTTVDQSAAAGRKDVRDTPLITIDGMDARDFDDAVWCEPLEQGWRLLVAIADVAHYVTPGSALDIQAIERGTSVYFPGRVVPMLPEVLSNGLCSLNPNVDRLCMICELTLSTEGDVKKVRFHNGIMRSHARLTYDQVSEMLTDPSSALRDEHEAVVPVIEELHKLYKVLAAKRRERGAIEFDSNETIIVFDDNKKIKEIVPIERNDAHKLIEECMILANIQAAAYLEEREIAALYRVHSGPKTDRLEDLRSFLALHSLTLGGGDRPSAIDYAALAESIADRPDRMVIQTVMLRSMQQAVYQPKNEGHFGLALDQYAHFTSPIRRYPDLLVHRALKFAISGGKPQDYRYDTAAMVALGESCSTTERRAEEASRDVVSWLKCEYMQDHVGSEFEGVITAVTSFGLFVDLTGIHIEGLVHITNLSRDYYRFDQAAQSLIGERTGRQYRLGDSIKVQVAAVNLEERKIDFNEVDGASGEVRHEGAGNRNQRSKGKQQSKAKQHKHEQRSKVQQRKSKTPVEPVAAAATAASPAVNQPAQQHDTSVSAEKRRQQKRKRKQKRRDRKRAEQRAANQVQTVDGATQTAQSGNTSASAQTERKAEAALTAKRAPDDKATSKKVAAKKAVGKKASAKKVVTEQFAAGQVAGKKVATKKSAAKKVIAKKEAAKKVTARQVVSKKVASKKVSAKRATGKIVSTRQVIGKKVATKQATGKKVTAQQVLGKKVAAKQATGKKVAASQVSGKKVAAKQATGKKVAALQVSGKKVAAKQATGKKVAASQVSGKKVAAKQATGKKVAASQVSGQKVAGKKVTGKKIAGQKVSARKDTAQKATTKKIIGQKAAGKKVAAQKVAGKKNTGKTATMKKVVGKKSAGNKATDNKIAGKKVSGKNVAGKKITGKKIASKKIVGKNIGEKKVAGKKVAGKKATGKQVAERKTTGKKVAAKKAIANKVSARKTAAKKATGKKVAGRQKKTGKKVGR